jgi:hypothetical protein
MLISAFNAEINMRNLILVSASVISLGISGAGAGHAAEMNNPGATVGIDLRAGYGIPANPSLAEIQQAQQLLRAQGLYDGPIDEIGSIPLDEKTKRAVAEYQKENSLKVTGILDQDTMLSLLENTGLAGSSTPPSYPQPPITNPHPGNERLNGGLMIHPSVP